MALASFSETSNGDSKNNIKEIEENFHANFKPVDLYWGVCVCLSDCLSMSDCEIHMTLPLYQLILIKITLC